VQLRHGLKHYEVNSAFLSPEDLIVLTGYKRSADQARWLDEHGIPFLRNSLGKIVVKRDLATVERRPELGVVR
jgi:succinate dehydrogenase/fumarate reductase flavoprotein subunit